jgi:hypothetical protein
MNKRIKELAEQNGFIHNWMPPGEQYELLQRYEKFAELIVRECIKAADEWYQYHNEIQWDPGEHIKQHFGVEE